MKNSIKKIAEQIRSLGGVLLIAFAIRTLLYGLYQVPSGSMETTMLVGERFIADKLTYWVRAPKRGEIIAFNTTEYAYSSNPLKHFWQQYVWGPDNWTKRVIGAPGDHVQGKIEDGHPVVYVNDEKLDEPYVNHYPLITELNPEKFFNRQDRYLSTEGVDRKSYDPVRPFNNQPFYQIDQRFIAKDSAGAPVLEQPGMPMAARGDHSPDEFDVTLGPDEYWVMGDNRLGSHDSRAWGTLPKSNIHAKILFRFWSMDTKESWMIIDLIKHPIDFWKKVRWKRCCNLVR